MIKFVSFLIIVNLSTSVFASEGSGGYAGAFLRMGIGARAKSMGDAFTAVAEDASAGFYNPALLPHLKERQVMMAFAFLPLDRSLDFIGYAQPLEPKSDIEDWEQPLRAGFSVAWVHAGVDEIDGRDSAGNHIGYFSNSEHAFFLSFALSPIPFFSIGLNGKVLYNRFPKIAQEDDAVTSKGFGMDFGLSVTPIKNLMLGVVLKDNMSKYTWTTDKLWERGTSMTYKFPRVVRAGVSYRIPKDWLLIVADVEDSKEQNMRIHIGAEASWPRLGALRVGLDDSQPTFGMGFFTRVFKRPTSINYTFLPVNIGPGADHLFSWTFSF